jgi:RHS repeat-associated protein
MVTTYTYDRAQRLTNLSNVISGTTITSHAYTLDAEGNRTALSEFVFGITTGASDSFGMTYDGLERLTAVTTTNAESFTLDAASNITARTGPSKTFTIDGSNRPTSDGTNTLTWSAADRLTGRGADTFGFDPLDRLTSSAVAGTARTYAYNGDGLLQSRITGGSTVSLLWDPATSPARLLVSGSDKIVYGLGPLYSVNGTTVTTYARDGQKSIRAELNGTSVTSSWRYRAYGEIAQNSGALAPSLLGYAGQLLDPSGLYYMRARWYDAANARWLSRDAFSGSAGEPDSLNAFGYAEANPVTAFDPFGLFSAPSDIAEGGGCAQVVVCAGGFPADRSGTRTNTQPTDLKREWVIADPVISPCNCGTTSQPAVPTQVGVLITLAPPSRDLISRAKTGTVPVPTDFPVFDDPRQSPGPDWEWRAEGNWYNPKTRESLHPDLDHPAPVGPHWDYTRRGVNGSFRIWPDGSVTRKR